MQGARGAPGQSLPAERPTNDETWEECSREARQGWEQLETPRSKEGIPPLPEILGSKGSTGISTLDRTIYTLALRKLQEVLSKAIGSQFGHTIATLVVMNLLASQSLYPPAHGPFQSMGQTDSSEKGS